jgi:hypothetical protein
VELGEGALLSPDVDEDRPRGDHVDRAARDGSQVIGWHSQETAAGEDTTAGCGRGAGVEELL